MNEDLIKRRDAIKAFVFNSKGERIPFVDCDNFPVEFPLRYIVDTLVAIPSTNSPRGKWLKVGGYCTPGGDPVWRCSECGKGLHVYGIEHGTYGADVSDGQWVACPNCGADMRGEIW